MLCEILAEGFGDAIFDYFHPLSRLNEKGCFHKQPLLLIKQ